LALGLAGVSDSSLRAGPAVESAWVFSGGLCFVVSVDAEETAGEVGGLTVNAGEGGTIGPGFWVNCGLVLRGEGLSNGLAVGIGDTPGPSITLAGTCLGTGTGMYGCL